MIAWPIESVCLASAEGLCEEFRLGRVSDEPLISGQYLAWHPSDVFFRCRTAEIGAGLLMSTHAEKAEFDKAERHTQPEMFLFTEGVSTMLLADGEGDWCFRSFRAGDALIISANAWHYLGPSVTERAACAVVTVRDSRTEFIQL